MNNMTFNEIFEQLQKDFDFYELLDSDYSEDLSNIESFGNVKCVSSEGFDLDSYLNSVDIQRTYHFEDHNIYLQIKGRFSSYSGTAYDEVKQVYPVEKTVIIYE